VFLDQYELEISDECNMQLEDVEEKKDIVALREFEIKYGENLNLPLHFPQRVSSSFSSD
jgi:hypothetical protein